MRSGQPLSNDRSDMKIIKSSVKHNPAGGIAMPAGRSNNNINTKCIQMFKNTRAVRNCKCFVVWKAVN